MTVVFTVTRFVFSVTVIGSELPATAWALRGSSMAMS